MGRPCDHYTHGQFEPLDSANSSGTVQCKHCRQWTGAVAPLNRKKDHLRQCPQYLAWRAAGNGQEIAPDNPYVQKRAAGTDRADYFALSNSPEAQTLASSTKSPNLNGNNGLDISQYYDQFWDDNEIAMHMCSRCKYCGFSRAKNATREAEHLQKCKQFLNSPDSQQAIENGLLTTGVTGWSGRGKLKITQRKAPNPQFARPPHGVTPTPNEIRPFIKPIPPVRQQPPPSPPPRPPQPSLVNFLLGRTQASLSEATQRPFLAKAGNGTLSLEAVEQFLTQENHISRAFPCFLGQLIGKIRLPEVENPQEDAEWRAFDLLVSALNNAKRELEFLRSTKDKCGLRNNFDAPGPAAKGLVDLMQSASAPSAPLLEGMIVLWAVEYVHCETWHYAARCQRTRTPTSTAYSLPTFYQGSSNGLQGGSQSFSSNGAPTPHGMVISESLIPNWTSDGFGKFVNACKAVVDELANSRNRGNGAKELKDTEQDFNQVLWLWKQIWPDVTDVDREEDTEMEVTELRITSPGNYSNPIDIGDENIEAKVEEDENASTTGPS